MKSDMLDQVLSIVEEHVRSRPAPREFEMAYEVRMAIDRIRFAIRATEKFAHNQPQLREAGLQLLDALNRLESADREFQRQCRQIPVTDAKRVNGKEAYHHNGESA